eukprot:2578746-Rhodomonas_salina.1
MSVKRTSSRVSPFVCSSCTPIARETRTKSVSRMEEESVSPQRAITVLSSTRSWAFTCEMAAYEASTA